LYRGKKEEGRLYKGEGEGEDVERRLENKVMDLKI